MTSKVFGLGLALGLLVCSAAAWSQTPPARSKVVSTTPSVVLLPGAQAGWGALSRICNVGTAGTAWLSRDTLSPAPNAAGSWPLPPVVPGQPPNCEEISGPFALYASSKTLSAVADTGTVQLTIEAY